MKNTILAFSFLLGVGILSFFVYRSIPRLETIVQAQPSPNLEDKSCLPKEYRNPLVNKSVTVGTKEYLYILAVPKNLNNSEKYAQELLFERDKINRSCHQLDFGANPFSEFVPIQVAIVFKQERWSRTLKVMGKAKFTQLLNTPPEIPNPFYLYQEDVEAIAKLGFKPGEKAKVIQSRKDLDYLYNGESKTDQKNNQN
jgi:hypothetical protein